MDRKTRATGTSVLIALGGLLAALMLMAGPAAAQAGHDGHGGTGGGAGAGAGHEGMGGGGGGGAAHQVHHPDSTPSGGCFAANGSVCSGSGVAIDNSTSSGDAVAVGGSVASGCSTAVDGSTASGGEPCPRHEAQRKPSPGKPQGGPAPTGGAQPEAGVAVAVETTELAFTGSSTGLLAGAAAAALALGSLLVFLGSERRRPAHSS